MQRDLVVITGPTGSGKSAIAELAGATIFNADPYQFYREIPILSNQPKNLGRYRFVADRSIAEPTNAGVFGREVLGVLDDVGIWVGVGLYLGAVLYGLDEDRKRGTPFQGRPRRDFRMLVLNLDRQYLYAALNRRVDEMIESGARKEADLIFEMIRSGKISEHHYVTKAIGLNHLIRFLKNEMTYDECIRLWKRDTRRLAKRQMTWLRKFCPPAVNILWARSLDEAIDRFQGEILPKA